MKATFPTARRLPWLYLGLTCATAAWFLRTVLFELGNTYPQDDMIWWVPTIIQGTQGKSTFSILSFLLDPRGYPHLGLAGNTLLGAAVLHLFGPSPAALGPIQLTAHTLCSILLYRICRHCGLPRRAGWIAAMLFLTFYGHFDAYCWWMASQHLLSVFFSLLTADLFFTALDAESRGRQNESIFRRLSFAAGFAASLFRITSLFFIWTLLASLWLHAPSPADRTRRIRKWLPLQLLSSLYPCIAIGFGRETAGWAMIQGMVAHCLPPSAASRVLPGAWAAAALIAGSCLPPFLLLAALHVRERIRIPGLPSLARRWISRLFLVGLPIALIAYPPFTRLLVAAVKALTGCLWTFLDPLGTVLQTQNASSWNWVQLCPEPAAVALIAVFLIYQTRSILAQHPRFIFLVIPAIAFPLIHASVGWENVPSRYLYYLSAPCAVALSTVLDNAAFFAVRKISSAGRWAPPLLACAVFALATSNTLAIRLHLLRHRYTNHFLAYDSIRPAEIIVDDLGRRGLRPSRLDAESLYVTGVVPDAYSGLDQREGSPRDVARHDIFRYCLSQASPRGHLDLAHVNDIPPQEGRVILYRLDGASILNEKGEEVDPFRLDLLNAIKALEQRRLEEAAMLLDRAVRRQPHLIRFLVRGYRHVRVLRWVTDGESLRSWINKGPHMFWSMGKPKAGRVLQTIMTPEISNNDIDLYAESLALSSILALETGNEARYQELIRDLRVIEDSPKRLESHLIREGNIRHCPSWREHLDRLLSDLNGMDSRALGWTLEPGTWESDRLLWMLFWH